MKSGQQWQRHEEGGGRGAIPGRGDRRSWPSGFAEKAPLQAPEGIPGGKAQLGGRQMCKGLAVGTGTCSTRGGRSGLSVRCGRWSI